MRTKKKNLVIYPGTFDPVTNGHLSLIERACHLFDEVYVAVAGNVKKEPFFDFDTRIELIKKTVAKESFNRKVEVIGFDGLLADLAIEKKATAIIRGLRAVSDFEIEFQMALMNRKLAREVETVFLMPALSWVYLSSTIVKDVAMHGGDIKGLVPQPVVRAFKKRIAAEKSKR